MEIQKTSAVSGISANANNPPKDFSKLPPGFSLNAVVAGKSGDNAYILKLPDGRLIRAQTLNELALGQSLKLEVVKTGAMPELKIVWPEHPEPSTQQILQNTLKQMLPKQVSLTDFALVLKQMANSPAGKAGPLSAAIQGAAAALLAKEDLMTAEGVKQGVANSGIFLEAKLARQLNPQGDIKGQLLALADALRQASSSQATESGLVQASASTGTTGQNQALLAKTEGAIARITLDQLASLPQNNEMQTTWQISIPFSHGSYTDTARLNIKREGSQNPAQQANWSVVLELNPPGLGPLHCKIRLIGDKVDTYFWSDLPSGIQQVQGHLDVLARRYSEAGLTVGNLNIVDGARMPSGSSDKSHAPSLLDDFA